MTDLSKFPVGSIWRTQCNSKAVIVKHDLNIPGFPLLVYHEVNNELRYHRDLGQDQTLDDLTLVELWKDPVYVWINVYKDTYGRLRAGTGVYISRELAEKGAAKLSSITQAWCIKTLLRETEDE